jgi:hypothetical protein
MTTAFRNIERARGELTQLHGELLQLEKRVNSVRESLGRAITELFGTDRQAFTAAVRECRRTQIRIIKSRAAPFSGSSAGTLRSNVASLPFLWIVNPNRYASVTCWWPTIFG